MKTWRDVLNGAAAAVLILGFLACLVLAFADRKGARGGKMHLQVPR